MKMATRNAAVPLSAALQASQDAKTALGTARQRLDAVFNLLLPGYNPPPDEVARLHEEVLELLAKYFKSTIPRGSVDLCVVPSLFYAAAAFAFASSAETLAGSLDSDLVKLIGDLPTGAARS